MRLALLLVAWLLLPPGTSFAETSGQTALIKHYSKVLSRLPGEASDYSQIEPLVARLVKLDPRKTSKYWKTGLTKFADSPTVLADVYRLQHRVVVLVKRSGLTRSQITKILKGVAMPSTAGAPAPGVYSL